MTEPGRQWMPMTDQVVDYSPKTYEHRCTVQYNTYCIRVPYNTVLYSVRYSVRVPYNTACATHWKISSDKIFSISWLLDQADSQLQSCRTTLAKMNILETIRLRIQPCLHHVSIFFVVFLPYFTCMLLLQSHWPGRSGRSLLSLHLSHMVQCRLGHWTMFNSLIKCSLFEDYSPHYQYL